MDRQASNGEPVDPAPAVGVMNDLDCLVYVSRCRLGPDALPRALADIVEVANFRNKAARITGILTCQDGQFIQLLEGSPSALDLLMIHLHFDERHEDIRVLARQRIQAQKALDWSMIAPPADHPMGRELAALLADPPSTVTPWREVLLQMVTETA